MGQTLAEECRTEASTSGVRAGWRPVHPTPAWHLVVIQYPDKTLDKMENEGWRSALQIFISSPVLSRSCAPSTTPDPNTIKKGGLLS